MDTNSEKMRTSVHQGKRHGSGDGLITVTHITSVHRLSDTRIRLKECRTLSAAGYRVVLLGSGHPTQLEDGIRERTVPKRNTRFGRVLLSAPSLVLAAARLRSAVYHIHDPELLAGAPLFKLLGGRVIYDAHEDLPKQVMSKSWIPWFLRRPVSRLAAISLPMVFRRLDAIVAATPAIAAVCSGRRIALVQNYPMPEELGPRTDRPFHDREPLAAYVGGLNEIRGGRQIVRALDIARRATKLRLAIAGEVSPAGFSDRLRSLPGWRFVEELGWIDRRGVANLLGRSRMGLVLFQPTAGHIQAQPTKLFEYMSAGVPVIASDFPLWRSIVEEAGCGLLVNPTDPSAIADAMIWVLAHPGEAERMGERGRQAMLDCFNWNTEAEKLVALYEEVLS
jgi:glycosyltransferase involved in cell wall biosynthesis